MKEETIGDVLNTFNHYQKRYLADSLSDALNKRKTIGLDIYGVLNTFNDKQLKVFYYLIGCALDGENNILEVLEVLKGDL